MRLLYNMLFSAVFALSAPYYFVRLLRRGNWRAGFTQRFGDYGKDIQQSLTNRHVLWVHAVSVGEMNVCVALVNAMHERMPNAKILVSTTTTTGMAELQKRLPWQVGKIYYPIDRQKYVSMAFHALHPTAIILIEGEIWPNFIWRARASHLPMFLVNARLSDRSFPRYRRFGFLFRELFGSFSGVGAQTAEYAAKLLEVGCRREAVRVLGNLKFDTANLQPKEPLDAAGLLRQLGVSEDAPVLVGGSTHKGEERMLAEQFARLRDRFPSLFLVLVPRHFERAREVRRELDSLGLKVFSRSQIAPGMQAAPGSIDCLLVDSTGELMSFYQCATVVFVGKSLVARGGQNPIEPASLGKPTVFGPHMGNFPDVARLFVKRQAAVQVRDEEELERTIGELLSDPGRRAELGANARAVVAENRGAIARTVEMIVEPLAQRGVFVAHRG